jgi:SAM-dependent methyltransferase
VGSMLNSSRVHLDGFVASAAASVPPASLVLDAGAGNSLYRHHFADLRYESADFQQVAKEYAPVDYVCDLAAVPVEDDRYELVVLTQVLEHLPDPISVLREMRRVLKPGGRIWASTPLSYEEHEVPYDFYRYTQFGLRHVMEAAGFDDVRVEWLEGYWGTLSYQVDVAARALRHRAATPLRRALQVVAYLAARADLRRKVTDRGHPKNYTVVATA